ncbi:MAG: hypothetical protein ACYS1A_19370 [Planctomycetota bacterium]|jgi:hypothetical protein
MKLKLQSRVSSQGISTTGGMSIGNDGRAFIVLASLSPRLYFDERIDYAN